MSRIGRMPVDIPAGVEVKFGEANTVEVKGPKGELSYQFRPEMKFTMEDGHVVVDRPDDENRSRAMHGLTRSLLANMVEGVTKGFKKDLEINGVGYRAVKQGKQMVMNLGYSHQVIVDEIPGITIDVPAPNKITISGPDKQMVGQFAADVRKKRPPEPYQGKGIKYSDEVIIRKEGKTAAKKS